MFNSMTNSSLAACCLFAVLTFAGVSCGKDNKETPVNVNAYALSENNLLGFDLAAPGKVTTTAITGLAGGETLVGIDFRPADKKLYGISSASKLYSINTATGAVTMIGAGAFTPALSGTSFAMDFNPVVDRIRIVSNLRQNFRLNPETVTSSVDIDITPLTAQVSACAYSNNYTGAAATTLFDIDFSTDILYKQDPPNNGTLVAVGPLGINVEPNTGFDIAGQTNKAYALLNTVQGPKLYSINLETGAATVIGAFPIAAKGLAIVP
ncbi:DUF4394 domain-containing protein [Chitinophaga lutea]